MTLILQIGDAAEKVLGVRDTPEWVFYVASLFFIGGLIWLFITKVLPPIVELLKALFAREDRHKEEIRTIFTRYADNQKEILEEIKDLREDMNEDFDEIKGKL